MRSESGDIFCSNCANLLDEETTECDNCGESLEDEVQDVKICPVCGCPLESGDQHDAFKEQLLQEEITIEELQWILTVLDNLLSDLPEEKIEEFAQSENFELYQKVLDAFEV